jgi:transcriptional regulator, propionate catabolism operon regulatory protein
MSETFDDPAATLRPRRVVIGAVALTRLSELMGDVIPAFDGRAEIELVKLGFEDAVRYLRRRGGRSFDVLVSAGSNGAYLKSRVTPPLVLVRPSGFDLMQALTRARQRSSRIGVVTHVADMPRFADFRRAFDLPVEQRGFATAEDARQCVSELVALGVEVIVGTGLVTELAEQAGIAGLLLYSEESVRAAFEQALDLGALLHSRSPADTGPLPPARRPRTAVRSGQLAFSGESPASQAVREQIRRYAASEATVLLLGETGSGKERVARGLHAQSARAAGPFVAVNCGALSESLLEAELFGHEEGAFTCARRGGRPGLVETAHRGTLLLDEIGEMPATLQTRLLRVLEEREVLRVGGVRPIPVDLRVIAATHRDLDADRAANRLRADLYYRLNVLRMVLPPLRARVQDLPLLIEQLQPGLRFTPSALGRLQAHDWPGNVRELRNLLERCQTLADPGTPIEVDDLLRWAPELGQPAVKAAAPGGDLQALLAAHGGDRQALARTLGISRSTLWRWLQRREPGSARR